MEQPNGKTKIILTLISIIVSITLFGTGLLAKGVIDNNNRNVESFSNQRTEYISRDERLDGKVDALKDDFFREIKEINNKQTNILIEIQSLKGN